MDSKKRERVTIGRIWGLIYPMLLYLGVTFAVEFIFMIAVAVLGISRYGATDQAQLYDFIMNATMSQALSMTLLAGLATAPILIFIYIRDNNKDRRNGTFVKYIDSFNDQSKAKEAANILYNSGVDIIFQSAGGAGQGVFLAAKERGKYAIGVDSDQAKLLPSYADVILFSVIKWVDEAVYNAIENLQKGEFKGGSTVKLGVKEDGIGISETLNEAVTDKAKDARTRAEEIVRSESLIIPDTLEKLLKFEAPSLKEKP